VATALLFSTIGIYFSARSQRTLSASLLTYSVAAFISFGLPILLGTIIFIVGRSFGSFQSTMEETLLIYSMGLVLSTNPGASALITQYVLLNYGTIGTFSMTLDNGDKVQLISPWIPFTILYLTLTVVFFLLAVRQVRKIEE
jgi:hypothetical protein